MKNDDMISLILDYKKYLIMMINERSEVKHEFTVNIDNCPLPWQTSCYPSRTKSSNSFSKDFKKDYLFSKMNLIICKKNNIIQFLFFYYT